MCTPKREKRIILSSQYARHRHEMQRRLNPSMKDVVKDEITKWLNAGFNYPISDSKWKSHFMVREGIILGHVVSERGIEVDQAKTKKNSDLI
ncbi:unnamed protein product [Spirodela intermedia]|uniref:Uncharacterized protein n=1 Tax=Spirodela intermedia TaxID=51605 RepID=A0A7I8JVN0_SPIIN|nr:unnamed protein product [Spirodela intermedia]CAA2634848.1 unnamed protein product [Spirodela intermedia]CAA6665270.1 unnamed protein product [Spirodela intermedia]CAA6673821.1 unnamed protein product [Spirodela intermedia]